MGGRCNHTAEVSIKTHLCCISLKACSVFVETPVAEHGYGFSPLGYANITLSQWVGVVVAQTCGLLFNDRLPLWRCRRNGGIWRPEFRLYPLLVPCLIVLPAGLGIFGAALEYHLHYMVLAFAVCIINITETALVPVITNYVNECFTGHAQEVTTALNFYRLILGLTVPFYVTPGTFRYITLSDTTTLYIVDLGHGWTTC